MLKFPSYEDGLNGEMVAPDSLLGESKKFGDALDFEGYEEGVPGQNILFGALPIRKKSFDDTENGIWIGVDRDGAAKASFGDDQDYITILPATGEISIFNGGYRRTDLSGGTLNFYTTLGVASGGIYGVGTNQIAFTTGGTGTFYLTDGGWTPASDGVLDLGGSSSYMNNVYTEKVQLKTGSATNPAANGELVYYESGATHQLRVQLGGVDYIIDVTAA